MNFDTIIAAAVSPVAFIIVAGGSTRNPIIAITGNASGGAIVFKTSDAGASGTTLQTLTTKGTILTKGGLEMVERSSDPDDPAEGSWVIWMSDGTGTGDDGDIIIKITASTTTKTHTLVDFSAV